MVIENIAIQPPIFEYEERGYLNAEILKIAEPFFNVDFHTDSQEDKVQWFYNLMYVAKNVDLGLAHALQHNQVARTHVISCSDESLKKKVLGVPFWKTIGSTSDFKPSDTVTLCDDTLVGDKNWLTNLPVADYVAMYANGGNGNQIKLVVDLHVINCSIDSDFPDTMGMGMAKPANLSIQSSTIPNGCILGVNGWPDRSFVEESFKHLSFLSTMNGITHALFDEVYNSAKMRNLHNDFSVIKAKLDVFTSMNNWIGMMRTLVDGNTAPSEDWWIRKEYHYLFGKKTLISILDLSRNLCVQQHVLNDSPDSKVFRHAISFASHMRRFENLQNPWGGVDDKEIDLESFIDIHVNKFVNGIDLPDTMVKF